MKPETPKNRAPSNTPPGTPPSSAPGATAHYSAEKRDRYTLWHQHATGGIGVIWLAHDGELGRNVALKELRPESGTDRRARTRFVAEARITGQLEHPGIVPVYELRRGSDNQQPYYTMRFVKGTTLTDAVQAYHDKRIGGQAGAVERNALLNTFVAICNTLAYAHSRSVIHRDLKGQNILLGDFGEVIVLDWGLAKVMKRTDGSTEPPILLDQEDAEPLTRPGQALGTPAFMAPEQAAGRLDLLDHRTDVYGLGAILYEILTGRPPFEGRDIWEVLRKVYEEAPVPPRRFCPDVPAALEAVCLRALAKDRVDRYSSATELAQDVQRSLADEPVNAQRESWLRWSGRWARRHQAAVTTAAAVLLVLTAVALGGVVLLGAEQKQTQAALEREQEAARKLQEAQQRTEQAHGETRAALEREKEASRQLQTAQRRTAEALEAQRRATSDLERSSYFQRIALSDREWERANVSRAQELLQGCPVALRGWEWYRLQHVYQLALPSRKLKLGEGEGELRAVAWSPDGKRLATAGHAVARQVPDPEGKQPPITVIESSAVKIWSVATGEEICQLRGHAGAVAALAWSPNGNLLASGGADRTIKLWGAEGKTYAEKRTLKGHTGAVRALSWSPDGERLATAGADKTVRIWDVARGEVLRTFAEHSGGVEAVAWNPDGKLIASAGADRVVHIWNAADGKPAFAPLRRRTQPVIALSWSHDGSRLALASEDEALLWDSRAEHKVISLLGHRGPILALAWSPDGKRVATGSTDRTAIVWDAANGAELRALKGHDDRVTALAWDPASERLVTLSDDRFGRVWNLGAGSATLVFNRKSAPVERLAWSPDGQQLATASWDSSAQVWDTATGRRHFTLQGHEQALHAVAWSPDGKRLATCSDDGTVRLWLAATGKESRTLHVRAGRVNAVVWSPDGQRLATAAQETVKIWDAGTGKELLVLKGHKGLVPALAWSPHGKQLASGGVDGTVRIWSSAKGELLQTLEGHTQAVAAIAWSPDGSRLASAGANHAIGVWDVDKGRLALELKGHADRVQAVSWSPDGKRLATAGDDQTVRIWEMRAGLEALTLRGHLGSVNTVAWSPDGRRPAAAGLDSTVRIWDAPGYAGSQK